MIKLPINPLTSKNFEPFGDVIETDGAEVFQINEGTTERFHHLANVDVSNMDGVPIISIFKSQPRQMPIKINMVERHPLGSQAFYPLQPNEYLVLVAKTLSTPHFTDLIAFRASGTQGVCYHKNIWHHPLLVLKRNHHFLVIDRSGPGNNLEEYFFDQSEESIYLDPTAQRKLIVG